jgi:hypothetical protein
MVDKTSHMFITGPDVIKTVTGEDVSMEDLGGARSHNTRSGNAHYLASDESDAIDYVKALLSYLPQNNLDEVPVQPGSDLGPEDLAQRAAEDREVLREDAHLAAVDGSVAGDHPVTVGTVLLHAERRGPVAGQLVELHEGALVQELEDPLAGGLLAAGVLLLHGPL